MYLISSPLDIIVRLSCPLSIGMKIIAFQ